MTLHRIGAAAATLLLVACSYAAQTGAAEPGSEVGGTGNIQYSHDSLGNSKHMVTVTAAPGLMETEGSIEQRIQTFATRYAARVCPGAFEFLETPGAGQGTAKGFMKRTKSYVFVCKPPLPIHD